MNFLKISLIISFLAVRVLSIGQIPEPQENIFVTQLGVDQGLRQSMVTHVLQDSMGLIWMTTGDGLHYFDGTSFRSFRVPIDKVYRHSDNLMRDIAESGPGVLTLSSTSSVLVFNTSSGKFRVAYRKEGCYPVLLDIRIDQKTAVWFADKQLCLAGMEDLIPQRLIFEGDDLPPENFSPKNSVTVNTGEILLSGEDGIILLGRNSRLTKSTYRARWIPVKDCQAMASDRNGRAFIFSQGKIFRYLGQGNMVEFFDTGIREKMNLFVDSKDNFWLTAKETSKQYRFDGSTLHRLNFLSYDGKRMNSITTHVRSVYEDRNQNIWFGTDGDGALLYSPGKVQFLRSDIGFTRCMAWFNNELWAGTFNEGLWRMSPDLSRASRVISSRNTDNVYYLDLAADSNERLWIVTRQGLEVVDRDGKTLFRHPFPCQTAKLVVRSRDTVLLFCDTRMFRFFSGNTVRMLNSAGFVGLTSCLILEDATWIGNQFGLYRCANTVGFDKDKMFTPRHQLSPNAVYAVIVHKGSVWAATGNGIELFAPDGTRKPVPAHVAELQNEIIYALLPDDEGRIWFSGNHGLGCIQYNKDHTIYFNAQNNLQSPEFNHNAACSSPGGKLYFGGIRGVNGFDPGWFSQVKKSPDVRLLSLVVSDSAYTGGIPPAYAEIALNRHAPHINGKVFCSDYTNTGTQLFSFFLEGYQRQWSKPSQNGDFNYRDLPPGNYRLQVKCADPWQNWSGPVTLVAVTINPPFWKTGWFLLGSVFLIIAVTALVARRINSTRYTRRIVALEQQNAIENERLRISKDMHDDLGASLTRISILSELAKKQQGDPVKSREIIAQISDISGGVVDDMSEIIWAMNPRNDSLDSLTSYIRQYASSYLETAGIDCHFTFPGDIPGSPMSSELRRNLFLTVKEALHNVVKHAHAENVHVQMDLGKTTLHLTLADDGRGFDASTARAGGNGLTNMRKRIEEHGGRFELTSLAGKGTIIKLSIQLPVAGKSH